MYWWEHRSKKKGKNDFEKDLFKLMNNAILCKTIVNMRKNRNIKLVKTEKKKKLFGIRT